MSVPRRLAWVLTATAVWLGVGLSLGMYYNYTYFGRAAGPLPQAVGLGGAIWYYLAVRSGSASVQQAWLWMAAFPVAGWVWVASLGLTARLCRTSGAGILPAATLGSLPLLLPIPWLAWLHAWTPHGPSWHRFVVACLERQFGAQPPMGPLVGWFMVLSLVGAGTELVLLWRRAAVEASLFGIWLCAACAVAGVSLIVVAAPFSAWS